MQPARITDRAVLEAFLRRNAAAHVYALADLDDAIWPDTAWYASRGPRRPAALCLVLHKLDPPIVYAVGPPGDAALRALLEGLIGVLPERFFGNLALGLDAVLEKAWRFASHGEHVKMRLAGAAPRAIPDGVEPLGPEHLAELRAFYAELARAPGDPGGRFFAPFMLEAGPYFGVRRGGRLVSAGGVHVLSEQRRVAALGNIGTLPGWRRQGLGRAVSAALCCVLAPRVDVLGLNVRADNLAARRCYEQLGFEPVIPYLEGVFERP